MSKQRQQVEIFSAMVFLPFSPLSVSLWNTQVQEQVPYLATLDI